jgi:hypothetical protein
MKKCYKIIVDQDEISFIRINVNEDGKAIDDSSIFFERIFEDYEAILNISDIDYTPKLYSIWDGEKFLEKDLLRTPYYPAGRDYRFAFIDKDNRYLGDLSYDNTNEEDEKMIAIFLSNPQILVDRIENE